MMERRGFSLLELIMVVIILAILATVTVPIFQKTQRRADWTKADMVTNIIYQAVQYYYSANNAWPPDQSWNWLDANCSDINAYLTAIGAGQFQVPLDACRPYFTYDLYGGGPYQCDPATGNLSFCYISAQRIDGFPGCYVKNLTNGNITWIWDQT